jgi:hypothetical protein
VKAVDTVGELDVIAGAGVIGLLEQALEHTGDLQWPAWLGRAVSRRLLEAVCR